MTWWKCSSKVNNSDLHLKLCFLQPDINFDLFPPSERIIWAFSCRTTACWRVAAKFVRVYFGAEQVKSTVKSWAMKPNQRASSITEGCDYSFVTVFTEKPSGHLDVWPLNQKPSSLSSTLSGHLFPNSKTFPQGVLEISRSQEWKKKNLQPQLSPRRKRDVSADHLMTLERRSGRFVFQQVVLCVVTTKGTREHLQVKLQLSQLVRGGQRTKISQLTWQFRQQSPQTTSVQRVLLHRWRH